MALEVEDQITVSPNSISESALNMLLNSTGSDGLEPTKTLQSIWVLSTVLSQRVAPSV